MNTVELYNEYRLIEKSDLIINGVWKVAQLLFFFLSFVFGSMCTFCFHMLIVMFDEHCVLFPQVVFFDPNNRKTSKVYKFFPLYYEKILNILPIDPLNTIWLERSACYLPIYVPLVSSIFGIVWTVMFLMYTSGRILTGLQRPWRVLPFVVVFSLIMSSVCLYATIFTHSGLKVLCSELKEVTGSSTCSFVLNATSEVYENCILDVFKVVKGTIALSWLHTICWLFSLCLSLLRVILVVDFQLVKVTVNLKGNTDMLLERYERQIRSTSLDTLIKQTASRAKVHFRNKPLVTSSTIGIPSLLKRRIPTTFKEVSRTRSGSHYLNIQGTIDNANVQSDVGLVPDEITKMALEKRELEKYPKEHRFIAKLVQDMIKSIDLLSSYGSVSPSTTSSDLSLDDERLYRLYAQSKLTLDGNKLQTTSSNISLKSVETDSLINIMQDKFLSEKSTENQFKQSDISLSEIELFDVDLENIEAKQMSESTSIDIILSTDAAVQTDNKYPKYMSNSSFDLDLESSSSKSNESKHMKKEKQD